ncbi:aminoglycoside phosphotransferase family protein [Actinomadura litoris]|uniref:aminoglycoside phosphotransferase family protein n=1 Tax=Actinomadura litoris TaxID=2678616 RepID=UPI001FA726F9|nr:aminoglycoside phosphotransferase family protein [Actinomadura litoris]
MAAGKMHADELDIDEALVRRLLAARFPEWAGLPIERFPSAGTVNALFRLGEDMSVRLPRIPGGVEDVEKEHRWISRLAPHLPVPVPVVLGKGTPTEEYPWPWSVHRWLDGENPTPETLTDPVALAGDLAAFITALQAIDTDGGPRAARTRPLVTQDEECRHALAELDGLVDVPAATAAWEATLEAPNWSAPPVWVHADLMPGNLLTSGGRLSAVIDFATTGIGDPACDMIVAWYLLPAHAREAFRAELGVDDATWTRGRGWALSMALIQLPYYKDTNPSIAAQARHVIGEVLAERTHDLSAS